MSVFRREDHTFEYPRYLKALQPVSARAQHPALRRAFLDKLCDRAAALDRPLRILEIGAGRGDQMKWMIEALRRASIALHYDALEPDPTNRSVVEEKVCQIEKGSDSIIKVLPIKFFDHYRNISQKNKSGTYDVVMARSVIDLMPVDKMLSKIKNIANKNITVYTPLTFAMTTRLAPSAPKNVEPIEKRIIENYHHSIQEKTNLNLGQYPSHEVVNWANRIGLSVMVRASDWAIVPSKQAYSGDEAYALQSILAFVYDEAKESGVVPEGALDRWWSARHEMLRESRLIYTANQFDILAYQ